MDWRIKIHTSTSNTEKGETCNTDLLEDLRVLLGSKKHLVVDLQVCEGMKRGEEQEWAGGISNSHEARKRHN